MSTTQPLVFDDTSDKQGICQDIDFICGTNSVSFPKADKVRLVNLGLDEVSDLIQSVDTNWSAQDSNSTDTLVGYIDILSGTPTYTIDTDFSAIRGAYVNIGSNVYRELKQLTKTEAMEADTSVTGTPTGFWLDGNKIYLNPTPNSTTTGNSTTKSGYGIKLLVQKAINYVATDATGYLLGYSPLFYRLASLYACRDYFMAKNLSTTNYVLNQITIMEQRLKTNYARRNKTQPSRMTPAYEDNK